MTPGQLKLRMLKQFPGLDLDLLEGWISNRHEEIIQELAWTRLQVNSILWTVAPVTLTVSVSNGSQAVALISGTLNPSMSGRGIRIAGDDAFYEFTYLTSTAGSIDRPYEGTTNAAASCTIFQSVYAMPADCRILADDAISSPFGPLDRLTRSSLNLTAPTRSVNGQPQCWSSYMDNAAVPPLLQVELYPVPDAVYSLPIEYTAEASVPGNSIAFLPWIEPATALVEGVTAKILRWKKDYTGAQLAMVEAKQALSTMRNNDAQRMPPTELQLPSHYISHRLKRWGC